MVISKHNLCLPVEVEDLLEMARKVAYAGLGFNYSALFNSLLLQQMLDGSTFNSDNVKATLQSVIHLRDDFEEQVEALFGAEMIGSRIVSLVFKSNEASLNFVQSKFGLRSGGILGAKQALNPVCVCEKGKLTLAGRDFNFEILQGRPNNNGLVYNMLAFADRDRDHNKSLYFTLTDRAAESAEALRSRWDEFSGLVKALA